MHSIVPITDWGQRVAFFYENVDVAHGYRIIEVNDVRRERHYIRETMHSALNL